MTTDVPIAADDADVEPVPGEAAELELADDEYQPGEEPDIQPIFEFLVAKWCAEIEGEKTLTKSDLARWLDVPRQRVSNWLSGQPRAPWWVVMRLCRRFKMHVVVESSATRLLSDEEEA